MESGFSASPVGLPGQLFPSGPEVVSAGRDRADRPGRLGYTGSELPAAPDPESPVKTWSKLALAAVPAVLAAGFLGLAAAAPPDANAVTISGGHDIGKDDHGRPCVLIAVALGVKTEVFREAFAGVTPAKGGRPSGEEAQRNKDALLKVLAPHKVTNERLDEVSDYYRFRPQDKELWKHAEAKAHAVVEGGKVTKVVVDEAGAGYTTPPKVTVKGFEKAEFVVTLNFEKDLKKNGGVKSVELKK